MVLLRIKALSQRLFICLFFVNLVLILTEIAAHLIYRNILLGLLVILGQSEWVISCRIVP